MDKEKKQLSREQSEELIEKLRTRFEKHTSRHQELQWDQVVDRLISNPEKLWSLYQMELSGGEPDVVSYDRERNEYAFYDCSAESPADRRSFCYDKKALDSRKENKPLNNAIDAAAEMGTELLGEQEYRYLQQLGKFDTKTSSWLLTPPAIRQLGGAIFGDRRYDHVFIYHNGAESYYAARGFRTMLKV